MTKEYTLNVQGYYREVSKAKFPQSPAVFFIYRGTFNVEERTCTLKQLLFIGHTSNLFECASHIENDYNLSSSLESDEALFYTFALDYTDSIVLQRIVNALVYELRPKFNGFDPETSKPSQITIVFIGNRHAFIPARFNAPSF